MRDRLARVAHQLADSARARPRAWAFGAVTVTVLGAGLAWALWPTTTTTEPPRTRQYLAFTACLLTTDQGALDPSAAPVWAGLTAAAAQTGAKIQHMPVIGAQTADNAVTYLNSLAQSGCNLIFAAGPGPTAAVDLAAPKHPEARFVTTSRPAIQQLANVTQLADGTPDQLQTQVTQLVVDEAANAG